MSVNGVGADLSQCEICALCTVVIVFVVVVVASLQMDYAADEQTD